MELTITTCTIEDLPLLVSLSRTTFAAAFETQNNPDDFNHYMDTAFHPDQLGRELRNPMSRFFFVRADGELAGYAKVNEGDAQTDLKHADGIELERIYVRQDFQGRKIGEWILRQVIGHAREQAKNYLWLGVWEANTAAIRFYERYGFTKMGTHPYYIGKDRQTDWLMRLDLGILEQK